MDFCIEKVVIIDSEYFVFVECFDGCIDVGCWIIGIFVGV